jgi:hypothetical protein
MTSEKPKLTRLSVNLNAETVTALHDVVALRGLTVTEAVRRAIAVYAFVLLEEERGRVVLTQNARGTETRELVLR